MSAMGFKKELALHCHWATRWTEETILADLILITEFVGDSGRDSMRVWLETNLTCLGWTEKNISCVQHSLKFNYTLPLKC